ncbi:MAG: hypothetical protein ACLSUX_00625 [Christensenellales bacterium]
MPAYAAKENVMPISDNILQKIKERAANNIMGINPANTNCDVVIAHYGSKIMKDPLLNKMFLNGRTQVACALDFTSIDKAWSSIEETLNGVAAERKKVLGESSPDRLGTVLLLLIEKADDIPKIKPIVEQINNRNKKNQNKDYCRVEICIEQAEGLDTDDCLPRDVPDGVNRVWKLTDLNKVAAFNLILLLTLHVFNKVEGVEYIRVKYGKVYSAQESSRVGAVCERINSILGVTVNDENDQDQCRKFDAQLQACKEQAEEKMNELTETFFSVAPCKLELLPQYSKLSRNADIHTVYGTDKEGHPICEIFRDNILKAAQEFFEKELCSQEETFFGEFPLSMFENKNIAKLIEHLKEKAELADRKEDEYHKDARMYAGAWEERLEEGIKEKFIVFFGSKFKALVEDAGNMRNDLCACRDILRPICFEDGNVGSHTDKLNWQGLDCDKLLETCEARSRFEMNEQDRIWGEIQNRAADGSDTQQDYLFSSGEETQHDIEQSCKHRIRIRGLSPGFMFGGRLLVFSQRGALKNVQTENMDESAQQGDAE